MKPPSARETECRSRATNARDRHGASDCAPQDTEHTRGVKLVAALWEDRIFPAKKWAERCEQLAPAFICACDHLRLDFARGLQPAPAPKARLASRSLP